MDNILRVPAAFPTLQLEYRNSLQHLWSGYGEIARYYSHTLQRPLVIKHIQPPDQATEASHPRGWNTTLSHQRKLRSYQVEWQFYRAQTASSPPFPCIIPQCLDAICLETETLLLLEDVDAAGFDLRPTTANMDQINQVLAWLAAFHAHTLNWPPTGLWSIGSYWHLATRPDEWHNMQSGELKQAAHAIDQQLNKAQFQCWVHGDAKLANFCFSPDSEAVVGLDFQYVGAGPGIKDVMLFLGSCLDSDRLFEHEESLLHSYFAQLRQQLKAKYPEVDNDALEREWRALYPMAWADFHRFLSGWKPDHIKINRYMQHQTTKCLALLNNAF